MMLASSLRMGVLFPWFLFMGLSEESYNPLSYLDSHRGEAYDKECRAVLGDGDVEDKSYKAPYEEEAVEKVT